MGLLHHNGFHEWDYYYYDDGIMMGYTMGFCDGIIMG